jgi:NAD(P)-dependent dehydrogenase (short-subunit alcohol dehydrogenase family)
MPSVGIATGAGRGMGLECGKRLATMVDRLVLVDLDEPAVRAATDDLSSGHARAVVEPFVLDVTDGAGLRRLADRVGELGTLRAVAHAAGISPTMSEWKRILTVDLVGTAMLAESLRPLVTAGTAMVCFASMAATFLGAEPGVDADAALDSPLDPQLLERVHDAVGPGIEDPGMAYAWAKRGVRRFVQQEAVRVGRLGGRVCSVSPGIVDTPQGRQEAERQPFMEELRQRTPLGRIGRAEELAAVVTFLLSDEASFLTGVDVLVDGGVCAATLGPSASPSAGRT